MTGFRMICRDCGCVYATWPPTDREDRSCSACKGGTLTALDTPNGEAIQKKFADDFLTRKLLFYQYADDFKKGDAITPYTWTLLQEQAEEKIQHNLELAPNQQLEHWISICAGVVPFGLKVKP